MWVVGGGGRGMDCVCVPHAECSAAAWRGGSGVVRRQECRHSVGVTVLYIHAYTHACVCRMHTHTGAPTQERRRNGCKDTCMHSAVTLTNNDERGNPQKFECERRTVKDGTQQMGNEVGDKVCMQCPVGGGRVCVVSQHSVARANKRHPHHSSFTGNQKIPNNTHHTKPLTKENFIHALEEEKNEAKGVGQHTYCVGNRVHTRG